jgi:hypothetical protein
MDREETINGVESNKDVNTNEKKKKILISHNGEDKEYCEIIVDFLEKIGLTEKEVICTCISGYGVGLNNNIYEWLSEQFNNDLYVIFMLSDNYYNSAPCLNEMGAAWVMQKHYTSIILPGFNVNKIQGAVDPRKMAFILDNDDEEIRQKLVEMRDILVQEFQLERPTEAKWNRITKYFIDSVHDMLKKKKKKTDDVQNVDNESQNNVGQSDSEISDICNFSSSTAFFAHRFGKAFPGVRGILEINDPQDCIERLDILLRKPLDSNNLHNPIWWFRGGSNLFISEFKKASSSKALLDTDEIKIKRVVAYSSTHYYRDFVYVETYPEEPTGVYEYNKEYIEEHKRMYGVCHEEYAVFENRMISRMEYDDGAAIIDGKVVDLKGMAELRIRYLTPYNFIICAHMSAINNTSYDSTMKALLNGILQGHNTVNDIIDYVETMPRNRNDY